VCVVLFTPPLHNNKLKRVVEKDRARDKDGERRDGESLRKREGNEERGRQAG